jgi:hypothetical protein
VRDCIRLRPKPRQEACTRLDLIGVYFFREFLAQQAEVAIIESSNA